MRLRIAVLMAAAGMIWTSPGQNAGRDDVAFHAAMKKEQVDGDLKGAIDAYRKLTQSRDRAVAAKALVRMGECYEKLGDAEARKAYERVVREFGDQAEPAAAARKRLAAMTKPAGGGPSVRMVMSIALNQASMGTVSPDGRYLLGPAPIGLEVRDLNSGQVRRLTKGEDWSPVLSPGGSQIAFVRWANEACEAWTVGFDGSGERMLWRPEKGWCVEDILGWFPDGKRFLAQVYPSHGVQRLVAVNVADASTTTLWEGPWMPYMHLSPDGKFVVGRKRVNASRDELWLLSVEDRSEVLLLGEPSTAESPVWLPDGKGLLFLSDRRDPGKTRDLWMLRLAGAQPQGRPTLIKADMQGVSPVRPITRDGAFYHQHRLTMTEILSTATDAGTGKALAAPAPISRQTGQAISPAVSRDGRWLAYFRKPAATFTLVMHSVETGEEKSIPTSLTGGIVATFFPEGRSLLVIGNHPKDGSGLHRLDVATGSSTLLKAGQFGGHPEISPDGKIVYCMSNNTGPKRFYAWDMDTGNERQIGPTSEGPMFPFALSPDGRHLAVGRPDGKDYVIQTLPATGGQEREIHRVREPEVIAGLAWSPDGRYVIFAREANKNGRVELQRIPAEGGTVQDLGVRAAGMGKFVIHPNGRRIDFLARETRSEVWVLENFLPKEGR